MAANVTETRSRVAEALGFWFVTLLICGVAGYASYRFGRDWIGDRLGGNVKPMLTTHELVDRVGGGTPGDSPRETTPPTDATPQPPPQKAVVDIAPTAPTTADRQNLRVDGQKEGNPSRADSSDTTDKPGSASTDTAIPDREAPVPDRDASPRASAASARKPHSDRVASAVEPRAHEPSVPDKPVSASHQARQPRAASSDRYTVRAGSFADRANADRLVSKLRAQGYQPFVSRVMKDGHEYHRVNVATVGDRDEALKLRGELRSAGYAADVSGE